MNQEIKWHPFNKSNVRRVVGSASLSILAVRRDGRGYYGQVSQIEEEYVELSNGDHRQNLYFFAAPTVFAVVETPPAPEFKLGQPRLKLGERDSG